MTMTKIPLLCTLVLMTTLMTTVVTSSMLDPDVTDLCRAVCDNPDFTSRFAHDAYERCHCAHRKHTTLAPTTTTDVCIYLCSIQLGGQACECSRPSLPGKK